MPHLRSVALSTFLFISVASSTAAAQTIPSPYTFVEHSKEWTLLGGTSFNNAGALGLGPQDAPVVGGRFAVGFGGALGLDVTGTLFLASRDVLDVTRPEDDRVLGSSDISVGMLDARLRLNLTGQRAWHGLQPFVAFGGGVAASGGTSRQVELLNDLPLEQWYSFGTRFAASFGTGANYFISDKISLRFDAFMTLWKIATPIGWLTVDNNPDGQNPDGEWVSAKSLLLGASWRF
jgi:hypothetical protein